MTRALTRIEATTTTPKCRSWLREVSYDRLNMGMQATIWASIKMEWAAPISCSLSSQEVLIHSTVLVQFTYSFFLYIASGKRLESSWIKPNMSSILRVATVLLGAVSSVTAVPVNVELAGRGMLMSQLYCQENHADLPQLSHKTSFRSSSSSANTQPPPIASTTTTRPATK